MLKHPSRPRDTMMGGGAIDSIARDVRTLVIVGTLVPASEHTEGFQAGPDSRATTALIEVLATIFARAMYSQQ